MRPRTVARELAGARMPRAAGGGGVRKHPEQN